MTGDDGDWRVLGWGCLARRTTEEGRAAQLRRQIRRIASLYNIEASTKELQRLAVLFGPCSSQIFGTPQL